MPFLRELTDGRLLLYLHVQPGAKKEGVAGLHGEALKLKLTAPPVDGKANKALIVYLAKLLRVPKSAIEIQRGHKSRAKQICITGCAIDKVLDRINSKN